MPTLEISLKKLGVDENGSVEKERDAYFSAVLFFPRSGVAQVVSTRKLPPLTDQFVLELDKPNPATERPLSWAEKGRPGPPGRAGRAGRREGAGVDRPAGGGGGAPRAQAPQLNPQSSALSLHLTTSPQAPEVRPGTPPPSPPRPPDTLARPIPRPRRHPTAVPSLPGRTRSPILQCRHPWYQLIRKVRIVTFFVDWVSLRRLLASVGLIARRVLLSYSRAISDMVSYTKGTVSPRGLGPAPDWRSTSGAETVKTVTARPASL
jgi:hypothetical protein